MHTQNYPDPPTTLNTHGYATSGTVKIFRSHHPKLTGWDRRYHVMTFYDNGACWMMESGVRWHDARAAYYRGVLQLRRDIKRHATMILKETDLGNVLPN